MDLLILGGTGLLGHMLWRRAKSQGVDAAVTLRTTADRSPARELWSSSRVIEHVDALAPAGFGQLLDEIRPATVINCIGITKARVNEAGQDAVLAVNRDFPHFAAAQASDRGIHFIHISTDCVFSGERGQYTENDRPDADDLYGRSKTEGEPSGPGVLTLRTSIVGRELTGRTGLLEWFLSNRGLTVAGYRQMKFSGLSTIVLADALLALARRERPLEGLYHVAADPIDKDALLGLFNRAFGTGARIEPVDEPRCDRTLDGRAFQAATGFVAPSWRAMVDGISADDAPYRAWRRE
jgi:dTDP-4-dehydrorhamnose reductase